MVWGLQASHFPTKIQSKNQAFSETPSWTSFFRLLKRPGAKMLDFGTPLASSFAQNGAQNRPSGVKNASRTSLGGLLLADLPPRSLSERPRAPFCLILDGFWKNVDGVGHHFLTILDAFLAAKFAG